MFTIVRRRWRAHEVAVRVPTAASTLANTGVVPSELGVGVRPRRERGRVEGHSVRGGRKGKSREGSGDGEHFANKKQREESLHRTMRGPQPDVQCLSSVNIYTDDNDAS